MLRNQKKHFYIFLPTRLLYSQTFWQNAIRRIAPHWEHRGGCGAGWPRWLSQSGSTHQFQCTGHVVAPFLQLYGRESSTWVVPGFAQCRNLRIRLVQGHGCSMCSNDKFCSRTTSIRQQGTVCTMYSQRVAFASYQNVIPHVMLPTPMYNLSYTRYTTHMWYKLSYTRYTTMWYKMSSHT